MKRLLAILFGLSLLANGAFLARVFHSNHKPSANSPAQSPDPAIALGKNDGTHAVSAVPVFTDASWSAIQDGDAASVSLLRQLGLSDAELRAIVRAAVDDRYADRERALRKSTGYWESTFGRGSSDRRQWKDPDAAQELAYQKELEIRRILGDAYEPSQPQLRRFASYLPFEKAWELQRIRDDYRNLRTDAVNRAAPLRLPDIPGQARYLDDQRRADIEALLTPAELRAYDLRESETAYLILSIPGFQATEQEFLSLYKILESPNKQPPPNADAASSDASQREKEKLEQQIRATLGEKRYADYLRGQDTTYQWHRELVAPLKLPPETALAGYELLHSLHAKADAFAAKEKASKNQRDEFVATLLRESQSSLIALYGEKGYQAIRPDLLRHFHLKQ